MIGRKYSNYAVLGTVNGVVVNNLGLLFHGVKIHDNILELVRIGMPIILGFIIAYLLTPIVNFFENRLIYPVLNKLSVHKSIKLKKRIRSVTILTVLIIVSFIIY